MEKSEYTSNESLQCIVRLKSELCKQMAATLRKQMNDKFLKIFIINHLYGKDFHFNLNGVGLFLAHIHMNVSTQ